MLNKKREIPIFYSINDAYVPYLSVSIESISEHASEENEYSIIVLYQNLTVDNRAKLAKMSQSNVKVSLVSMDDNLSQLMGNEHTKLRGDYFTYTIYFRLFIAEMFPKLNKGIYLDADTVVNCDIAEFYELDLAGNLLAAAPDTFAADNTESVEYVEKALGIPIRQYFNSGVLLMDLERFREVKFADRFLNFLNTYQLDVLAADQDYLNLMTLGKVLILGRTWNTTPTTQKVNDINPHIVHYCLFYKPWHYRDVQNRSYFWKYAQKSTYYELLQSELADYSKEDRENDLNNLHFLLNKALEVVAKGETKSRIEASQDMIQ
ncbi:glycosyltransferase family 8 protein [Companilactobacillus huachuanensis]|uniref:Glycosyltransferase family 8 protein n=1 Tax=Companilactobacillus huachuanensis TaxID=2559914 RepID=A0ABW1RQ24_9LACO|nr:glycosyltransferase family 8 protein [Companilactobacillus huachuanensis]